MRVVIPAWVALLACVLLAAAGRSQSPPPGDDIVGLYTGDFTGPSYAYYEGSGPQVNVFVVFSGLSCPDSIRGWELAVQQSGTGAMFLSAQLLGNAPLNLWTPPAFSVGLAMPLHANAAGVVPVARLLYFLLSYEPVYLSIVRAPYTTWPDAPGPGYAGAEAMCEPQRCYLPSGEDEGIAFGFNTGLQPVAYSTWGGIKGMYR